MTIQEIKVLILTGRQNSGFRQLPNKQPIVTSGNRCYHFYLNDFSIEPDIVIVRNKYLKKELTLNIAPENTILMLSEPSSVVNFPKSYRNQFGMLYSCQADITHKNVIYGQAMLPWFVGVVKKDDKVEYTISYDDLKDKPFPRKKKTISVITSNKAFTRGHQARIDFVVKLKQHYGELIDVYGRGFNGFDDKWDVLKDYKYHIAIENCSTPYYWTEKLSDCYLAGCYPIYYGATNVTDYFSPDSLSIIDINDFEGTVARIDKLIANDTYEKAIPYLEEAKDKVLDEYNMYQTIVNCCDKLDVNATRQTITLKPSQTLFDWRNFYNYTVERNLLLLYNWWQKIIGKRRL